VSIIPRRFKRIRRETGEFASTSMFDALDAETRQLVEILVVRLDVTEVVVR
jgi:hypothetical protein